MKLRVKELAEALKVNSSDILSVCAILRLPAKTNISSLSLEDCKQITDYFENLNNE